MAITLKSQREIGLMREAGSVVADVLLQLKEMARPGVTTAQLNTVAEELTRKEGAQALFKGVIGQDSKIPFPGAICASINEQVVHGIPSESVKLKDGDILSVDFGVRLNGYCADAAFTVPIGLVDKDKLKLIDVTEEVLDIAIDNAKPGVKWSRIASKMQEHTESASFSVVRDLVGHGIGMRMHEEPQVPNFVSNDLLENDIILAEGMVLAVEPMINMGSHKIRTLSDGWTVVTKDGKSSAHFEHTIAIVKNGCKVLTVKKHL